MRLRRHGPEAGYDCDGNCINDADGDGVCDEFEVAGCQDAEACNYDADATDAGDCEYAEEGYDCDGTGLVTRTAMACATALNRDVPTPCLQLRCRLRTTTAAAITARAGWKRLLFDYSMTVEVYGEDLLAGHTTYRFYMNMANEDDFLSRSTATTSMPSA